jgi:hypothetical protein
MKTLNLILILLIPFLAYSQSPINDTSFVRQIDSIYYLVYKVDYSDGSYSERQTYIGTVDQFYLQSEQKFESTAMNFANIVTGYNDISKQITVAIRENSGILAITGKSPIDTIGQRTLTFLNENQWDIWVNSQFIPITFFVNNNGVLRYQLEGATAKNFLGFGKWAIRLIGFPDAGSSMDLFYNEGRKRYESQDGKTWIRMKGANRNN